MAKPIGKRVVIIDYQMGNLFSVENACAKVGLTPIITSDPATILASDAAILPGVGAFGEAMDNIRRLGLEAPIRSAIDSGRPFLGVCLGLQLLFTESEEFGSHKGLGIIPGIVRRFSNRGPYEERIKVPQIGWNQINAPASSPLAWAGGPLEGTLPGTYMYFVHSFYVTPDVSTDVQSVTTYGGMEYCSSIRRKNIFATQFHPEKSAHEGLQLYRTWAAAIK
jgi:imidazole glycerol-phosphate synthase subunit HisH